MTERYRSTEDLSKAWLTLGEPKRLSSLTPDVMVKLIAPGGIDASALCGSGEVMEFGCGDGEPLMELENILKDREKKALTVLEGGAFMERMKQKLAVDTSKEKK